MAKVRVQGPANDTPTLDFRKGTHQENLKKIARFFANKGSSCASGGDDDKKGQSWRALPDRPVEIFSKEVVGFSELNEGWVSLVRLR